MSEYDEYDGYVYWSKNQVKQLRNEWVKNNIQNIIVHMSKIILKW